MSRWVRLAAFAAAILGLASCGPAVDLAAALRVDGLSTGWQDAGYADGLNKITPSITLTLTNTSKTTLGPLHLNAVFRQSGHASEWSARFAPIAGSEGFRPGSSKAIVLTSDLGYTSFDPVEDILLNSQFVDADVDLFARYGASQWIKLARYRVDRHLVNASAGTP
jgi:hypothetical protein